MRQPLALLVAASCGASCSLLRLVAASLVYLKGGSRGVEPAALARVSEEEEECRDSRRAGQVRKHYNRIRQHTSAYVSIRRRMLTEEEECRDSRRAGEVRKHYSGSKASVFVLDY